ASGGWLAIQVTVLPCCSRTACDVTTRLPKAAVSSATTFLIAAGFLAFCSAATCVKTMRLSSARSGTNVSRGQGWDETRSAVSGCGDNRRDRLRRHAPVASYADLPKKG